MTTDSKGRLETGRQWRTRAIKVILGWLHEKWLLRCKMVEVPEATEEYERTLQGAESLWARRHEISHLEKDRYLIGKRNQPKRKQNLDILKCWNDAVRTAERECKEYAPEGQTKMTDWLERPQEPRTSKNILKT